MADRNSHRARWAGTVQSWKESGLTPWRDPTSSRNTDNRTSLNKDPYLGEGEATPAACPRTPKCGADWPRRTFALRRKGLSC